MQLKKISLENFKCFRKLDMDLGKITLLTGANSSGKSSLIYAILGMMQTQGFPYYFSPNGKYINMGSFEDLSWNHEKENVIRIGLEVNNFEDIFQVDTFWIKNPNNMLENADIKLNSTAIDVRLGYVRTILEWVNFNNFNYLSSHRQPTERLRFQESKSEYIVNMYGENYDLQILDWKENHPELLKELVKHIKAIRLFENIKIKRKSGGTFELLVKNHAKSVYQNLYDVGTGVSHFLPIMVADLQLPQNSTLIVSDPELHLHPSVQANFGTYLVNQVRDNQKNYIIETHSEYLLNRLRLEIVKGNIAPEDVKVYYLQNNGTESECFSIDLLKNGQIQGAPAAFFDTYMKDNMDIALNSFA